MAIINLAIKKPILFLMFLLVLGGSSVKSQINKLSVNTPAEIKNCIEYKFDKVCPPGGEIIKMGSMLGTAYHIEPTLGDITRVLINEKKVHDTLYTHFVRISNFIIQHWRENTVNSLNQLKAENIKVEAIISRFNLKGT